MVLPLLNITLQALLFYLLLLSSLIALLFLFILYVTTKDTVPVIVRYESERTFLNPCSEERTEFPFNVAEGQIDLSVVVPAYNEEERLPVMLEETMEYLEKRQNNDENFRYEVIIVDDGSKDNTSKVGLEWSKKYGGDKIRVLTFEKNRGKGGAVRMGVFCSRGHNILFVDADGATKFSDLVHVEQGLEQLHGGKEGMAVSVGSRAHLQNEAVANRSLFRNILMYGFHAVVYILAVKGIKDTQCGFKLFTRAAALTLFSSLHVERWAFDVELLYVAQALGIPIAEKAVNWEEIDGSKMIPIFSWIQMGKDILLIRCRYLVGAWKICTHANLKDL